jgi:hypothetical protein
MNTKEFLKAFRLGFSEFGENIGLIINSFLLTFVYVFGVGFTSIIAKIFKKHFLEIKIEKKQKSYWSNLNLKKRPIEEYYRRF